MTKPINNNNFVVRSNDFTVLVQVPPSCQAWMLDLFWKVMMYAPEANFCKAHCLYYCLDCGQSLAAWDGFSER